MFRQISLAVLIGLASFNAHSQTPTADLLKPPADARHYIIQSTGGKHGDSYSWTAADGTRLSRESMGLRGQVFELDATGKPGKDGMPATLTVRGVTPQGDAGETFSITDGKAAWKSPVDSGGAAYTSPAYYSTLNGPVDTLAWLVDQLLASPDKTMALLPGGKARAEKLTTLEVGEGANKQTITGWAIYGLGNSPLPVWADANNKFFGYSFFLSWLPEAYKNEHQRLTDAQTTALAARMPELRKSLLRTPTGPVAFLNVKLFDADAKTFLTDQAVLVENGRIVKVGPAKSVKLPQGTMVINGAGKTLIPGLWDSHAHIAGDYAGVQELSLGVTSLRDPGNDDSLTIDRRTREAKGELLMPNVYPSSLIDGRGPYTAQVANTASSEAELVAQIVKAKEKGFTGVKFYGTLKPEWIPAAAAKAHELGLHVHGHIPAGMRPLAAINAGYDEVTHINWIMMQAMPQDVIAVSNGIMRFEGPGRYAKGVDLDGPVITEIIATMAKKGIYSDPTMVAFEGLYVPESGDLSPAYAPFVGTLPPSLERGFRLGGFAVPKDLTRADYRASWAKMVKLLGKMRAAGVPIVAGTDGIGIELIRELEIYVEAGFSNAEALAAATIMPAKLVGQDKNTGSIKEGKVADLVLIEGDPEQRIGDLRHTRTVMLGGKLLDADQLRAAAGFSGRPK